jgi:PAS domain S-box-containing protein
MTMSSSSVPVEQVSRFVTQLAIGIAVLGTLTPPLGFLAYAWKEATEGLVHHSEIQAMLVSRYVTRNPEVWHDTRERLLESLTGVAMPDQHTIVIDNSQQTIGELGPLLLKTPVLSREAPFHEFGVAAGIVRVEVSMAETFSTASVILLLSGLLGALVFAPMRRIPLAALRDSVRRLVRSEERFRRLTELSSDCYWEQDKDHRFTSISDGAKRSGFDVEASLGRTLWEIATGTSLEAWAEHRRTLDARTAFRDVECAVRNDAGEEIWISSSGEPTFDEQGHFAGYHGTARDQTLRRRTESILRNQKDMLNEMVEQKTADLQNALETSQQLQKQLAQTNRELQKFVSTMNI